MANILQHPLSFFEKASGVLGINARNLLFVNRYNTRADKKFADDKIFTKNYLSSRGIGVAKVYTVIKNYKELTNFNLQSLPNSFVIKPNRGYGGEGILVIVKRTKNSFVDINNKKHSQKDVYRHLVSILDGRYAISGLSDQAIIEERLVMDDYFKKYTDSGLPDIRIIVFNYVPVIAMLRLPNEYSNGKANLHLGAVGVGIDISSGKALHAVFKNKFITKLPNGQKVSEIKIPHWQDALLTAAKAQHASQIGFLAVDIAPTNDGSKILELNARAGLAVQIANQVLLKNRLKKVADLSVPNPIKGVEISKTLFSSNIASPQQKTTNQKPVIGLYEYIEILDNKYKKQLLFKIDPHFDGAVISSELKNKLEKTKSLKIKLKNNRLVIPTTFADLANEKYQGIIGSKFLSDFLIDNNLNKPTIKPKSNTIETEEKIILNIDKKLEQIEKRINILGSLRPINLDKAKEEFLRNQTKSPIFLYPKIKLDINKTKKELLALPTNINHPLAKLFKNKIKEIKQKLDLLEAIDSKQLQTISSVLYGRVDRSLYESAKKYIVNNQIEEDDSEILTQKIIINTLEEFLKKHKLQNWKVVVAENRTSDIAVNKNGTIFLRDGINFTTNRLKAIIAHEICTHIYRLENGKRQPYKIFTKGTANYLTTEEGLAIYSQKQLGINLGEKDIWPALRVIAIYLASEMSFAHLFNHLKNEYSLSDTTAWVSCLKAKRGLINTDKKIAFTRDSIYFKGYQQIINFSKTKPIDKLYIGKVSLGDLKALKKIKEIKDPLLLPNNQEINDLIY